MLTLFSKWRAKRRVLAWVNDVRLTAGYDAIPALEPATRQCVRSCVIARALDGGDDACVTVGLFCAGILSARTGVMLDVPLPDHVYRFVREFDRGHYPELIGA